MELTINKTKSRCAARTSTGRVARCLPVLLVATLAGCGGTTKTVLEVTKTPTPPVTPYRVPSGSMKPTLSIGQVAWVEAAAYTPKVGDIVIFHPPEGAEQEECGPTPHVVKLGEAACAEPVPEPSNVNFIKRIVAAPGDMISIVKGHVIRNGKREPDSYIKACGSSPECNFPTPIKIPAGHWFMMGDNRGESDDSRFWGPVPTGWITSHVRWCGSVGFSCPSA
jgi:signal peptidase I